MSLQAKWVRSHTGCPNEYCCHQRYLQTARSSSTHLELCASTTSWLAMDDACGWFSCVCRTDDAIMMKCGRTLPFIVQTLPSIGYPAVFTQVRLQWCEGQSSILRNHNENIATWLARTAESTNCKIVFLTPSMSHSCFITLLGKKNRCGFPRTSLSLWITACTMSSISTTWEPPHSKVNA